MTNTYSIYSNIRLLAEYGYFHSLEDLLDSSDESLFRSIRYNPQHVLHQLLPPPKHTGYNLRSCGHGHTLSVIPPEFMRNNFINRMLFNDCGRSCLSRQSLRYTALGTGCAPLLQCLGRLSLPPSVGR